MPESTWFAFRVALALTRIQSLAVVLFAGVVLRACSSFPSVPSPLDAQAFWATVACLIVGRTVFAIGRALGQALLGHACCAAGRNRTAFGAPFDSIWMGEVIGKAAWAGARPDSPEERLGWRRYRLCSTSRGNQPKAHQLSGCSWAADVKL